MNVAAAAAASGRRNQDLINARELNEVSLIVGLVVWVFVCLQQCALEVIEPRLPLICGWVRCAIVTNEDATAVGIDRSQTMYRRITPRVDEISAHGVVDVDHGTLQIVRGGDH